MGIEALNAAARAAGFAMAAPDDTPEEEVAHKPAPAPAWRPGTAVAVVRAPAAVDIGRPSQVSDWLRTMFGASGRGAPAGAR